MRIVFAGTPDFAVPSLKALAASRHEVALIVTQPDRPAGRRRRLMPPPVKQVAGELGLRLHQTEDINILESHDIIRSASPDVIAVVAFGQKLGRTVLDLPPNGCVNVHASLLPRLRGAAPINWAILNGDAETGVTTQHMVSRIDAGDILLQECTAIGDDETAGELFDRLAPLGADVLVRTLDGLEAGALTSLPQDHSLATFAPTLSKADGIIDWTRDPAMIRNFVRGMNPWPSASSFLRRQNAPPDRITIHAVRPEPVAAPIAAEPGEVIDGEEGAIVVAAGSGLVRILELQRAGGKMLDTAAFLRGHPIRPGDRFHGSA